MNNGKAIKLSVVSYKLYYSRKVKDLSKTNTGKKLMFYCSCCKVAKRNCKTLFRGGFHLGMRSLNLV